MKKIIFPCILIIGLLITNACENDSNNNIDIQEDDYTDLLTDYANNTVISTYEDMKNNAFLLYENVENFKVSGFQTDVDLACDSWKNTRAPWEMSESFLFGPAAYNNLDPLLDSWPLDQAQLEQVLAGDQELTATFVRDGLGAVLRGFHTIEYLLFRDGQNRKTEDFTTREKEYLLAVTQVLRDDCVHLWASWNGVEKGTEEAAILENLEITIDEPFINEFAGAGEPGSRYNSSADALDELIQGIIDIADEVANAKLADPYTTKDVLVVESWHSWNSLTDFKNNIHSIENAYTSQYKEAGSDPDFSLSGIVSEKDEELDTRVKLTIQAAIDALDRINEPFRNNLNDDVNIPAAMSVINDINIIFKNEVRPLVLE